MSGRHVDIMDPVHGFVRLGEAEQAVADTPAFQRLRRIRQLASAYLVYPCAQHARFEHSLGVMHIAGLAGESLLQKEIIDADQAAVLRLAGLLHDIGHGPFSHTFEALRHDGVSHEDMGRRIIEGTEISDLLKGHGHDPKAVSSIAFGGSLVPRHLTEALSGPLSADMMDYLLRDGHFTGAEHAKLDHRRITKSLDVYEGRLAIDRSARNSFESMMHSRYQMFKAVYLHKTVRAAEVMLNEAVRLASRHLCLDQLSLKEYLSLDDAGLLSAILRADGPDGQAKKAQAYVRDYLNRRLFKCVYESMGSEEARPEDRAAEMRQSIAARAQVPEDQVFVDAPVASAVPVSPFESGSQSIAITHAGPGGARQGSIVPLSEIPLVSPMSKYLNIVRVYAPHESRGKVEIAASAVLGGNA